MNETPFDPKSGATPLGSTSPYSRSSGRASTFDALPFALAVARHWPWLVIAFIASGAIGYFLGRELWSDRYVATAQVIRYETPVPQLFEPRVISSNTLSGIINAKEVHARVGNSADPQLSANDVAELVSLDPERNSDIINVRIRHPSPERAVDLANLYAEQAAAFTRELQVIEATEAAGYIDGQLEEILSEIAIMEEKVAELAPAPVHPTADPRASALMVRLDEARDRMSELLGRYTDAHPLVQEQKARVEVLEQQVAALEAQMPVVASGSESRHETLRGILGTLESQRLTLVGRRQLAGAFIENPTGYIRHFAPATNDGVTVASALPKIAALALFSSMFGFGLVLALVVIKEAMDRRLKNAEDVRRVTQLPVLASVGRLDDMSPAKESQWAFRTWMALQNRLSESPNRGLVCGFTSARSGEGRSRWVRDLSAAANRCGFRVLNITTRPSPQGKGASYQDQHNPRGLVSGSGYWKVDPTSSEDMEALAVTEAQHKKRSDDSGEELAVTANVLSSPDEIAQRLDDRDGPPLVHIPLPGWVWNLERRREWMAALKHWSSIENVVILIELPPASLPETVLLAQNLPNLVWISDVTQADAGDTVEQLKTLRQARCNLVGAVVNRSEETSPGDRFLRWLPRQAATVAVVIAGIALNSSLPAQDEAASPSRSALPPALSETTTPTQPQSARLSTMDPMTRAPWQERLTLGPGDILTVSLYGEPELTREEIAIQPDGRLSFLEAQDLMAAGLTVDELRERLDLALGEFRRAPRTMVIPLEIRSKKYYMLGKVSNTGAYPLNRPLTIVEAVARARGFETGLSGRNTVELVDLSRAFLMREGERMNVDFVRLFNEGDLSQNIALAPGDYLYFPSADMDEVHLLGEVEAPGSVEFTRGLTAARAIASAGGFTNRAWRYKVLVLRGSLENPQLMSVNVVDVLQGKETDLELQPGDIVYVSERSWISGEELLDEAARAFLQSVVVFWTNENVFPIED